MPYLVIETKLIIIFLLLIIFKADNSDSPKTDLNQQFKTLTPSISKERLEDVI